MRPGSQSPIRLNHFTTNNAIMKDRCSFELQFCDLDLHSLPTKFDTIQLRVEHRDGRKRYGSTPPVKPSFGTAAAVPKVAFECGVYASKTVQLRLMAAATNSDLQDGSSTPRTSRLLGRSNSLHWQLLATAPLPLGQLAPTRDTQADDTTAADQLPPDLQPSSSIVRSTSTSSSVAGPGATTDGTASPFMSMSGAGGGGAATDDAFTSESLAAAAASLVAQQQQQSSPRTPRRTRLSSGEESAASQQVVSGMWVAGSSQVTRLTLYWTREEEVEGGEQPGALEQEVSVAGVG